jgi:hypothetical protein
MRFRFIIFSVILILQILVGFACRDKVTEPLLHTSTIQLTADDVGVTDALLRLKITDTKEQRTDSFQLRRNGQAFFTTHGSILDTLIFDENLLPKHTYTYKAYRLNGTIVFDSSDALTINTMDTTSHNFTWEIDTLGDGNSSMLRDVAIINDTCVWAVGEIYKKDSTGQFETDCYGAAVWNGKNWNLIKVPYHDYGSTNTWPGPLKSIYSFGPNEVYVTSSANLLKWDGSTWQEKAFFMTGLPFNGQVNKMWGTSGSNIYCVGNSGAIYFYDGSSWEKIESGTTLDIQDIWGAQKKTGEWEILAVAGNPYKSFDRKVLSISGTTVTILSDSGIYWPLSSVWFSPNSHYYVVGSGVYEKHFLSENRWKNGPLDITSRYIFRLRGNNINDVIGTGGQGEVIHFNGVSWKSYYDVTKIVNGNYYSIAIKGNWVVAVGQESPRAIVAIGSHIERR